MNPMLQESIEKQSLIININMMQEKSGQIQEPFEKLYSKSLDELREMQESLIPVYNESVKA